MPESNGLHGSEPVLDVETLAAAIPGDLPCGADLRTDDSPQSAYYRIKDARNAARAAERAAIRDPESATEEPDWRTVLDQGNDILGSKAKDLEVVAWMIEALVRIHGLAGLRDGFRVARELVERHWDGLWPSAAAEGVESLVAPLAGLNGDEAEGTLIGPIRALPLTDGASTGPYALWQYEQALDVAKIADMDARQKRIDAGAVALPDFEKAVAESGIAFYRRLRDDLAAAQAEYGSLCTALDGKAGSASPPSSNIRDALMKFAESFGFVTSGLILDEVPADAEAPAGDAAQSSAAATGGQAVASSVSRESGEIRNRDDAFRQLDRVAEWFRRTEPHSPISYSLEQAVRWGRLPLPDLLSELIGDDAVRGELFKVMGIRKPPTG
ncbi:MAG: type VI secretion system protein TssA [Planctomycetes bacterium]|nr:type VI secretion system protein TssA [Planctomycetota bacterium]